MNAHKLKVGGPPPLMLKIVLAQAHCSDNFLMDFLIIASGKALSSSLVNYHCKATAMLFCKLSIGKA